ncbi:hypothetical protein HZY83_03665 [Gemella sp. GH3]|uniref:hypothetical protein n=1 Tax=unclassified Gemella TaxID=2624949 RepID=UPI0015CFF085|nr:MULTISPECIES: hypothetical protein [unclassified Gemella]MBF0713778.1 hypothetical protein [Gemella sp. GH3.1]NYS50730.1 hypothetical protein [Gemella sp. GH3]
MEQYEKIYNYDFGESVIGDKVVVKFTIKNSISAYKFLTLFKDKKGERFSIKKTDSREIIVGIGHEYTWNLDTNDFLKTYDNTSVLDDFANLLDQTTVIEIDNHKDDYFGLYGGVSDGNNKKSQEWIDFSDTMFVIPNILAVFYEEDIHFTIFFKKKKDTDIYTQWRDIVSFLGKLDDEEELSLEDPEVKVVREIYPEVWQNNIKLALEEINADTFSRIALSRKNQLVLEKDISLPSVVKYFLNKKLPYIAFESKKSMFVTSNPLLSLSKKDDDLSIYMYLQKESLFNGDLSIDFNEEDIEQEFVNRLEAKTGYNFTVQKDKRLIGSNLDVYSMFSTKGKNSIKDIKLLSLLYPLSIIKGHPKEVTEKFLIDKEDGSYGFWYYPFGFINSKLDCKFYSCGNMLVSLSNIITIFTTILVNKNLNYEDIVSNSDKLVLKNLKLFADNNVSKGE